MIPSLRRKRGNRTADQDHELIKRLRAGEEEAFVQLAVRHHAAMLQLASSFVPNTAIAEEVVQDTWLAVLRGIDGFGERSSFKTWMLRILVNRARSTGVREHRSVAIGDATPAVDRSRFDASGAWMAPPQHWIEESEDRVFAQGLSDRLRRTLERLPARQREVLLLRDVEGLSSQEVCEVLAISEVNQRVLLHRGRSQLRQALEELAT
ncbi:MAG: sigma-70 family RNA polymerase sigma factor [Solirubrobacterales bacterium]